MGSKNYTLYISLTSIILLIFLIGISLFLISNYNGQRGEGDVFVIRVIDGDTLQLSDNTKIRLLCVDTPEIGEKDYERATKFLEALVLYKEIRLEKAETLDEIDKYNRDLSFVYVTLKDKEVFVNKAIIENGMGDIYAYNDEDGECLNKLNL